MCLSSYSPPRELRKTARSAADTYTRPISSSDQTLPSSPFSIISDPPPNLEGGGK